MVRPVGSYCANGEMYVNRFSLLIGGNDHLVGYVIKCRLCVYYV